MRVMKGVDISGGAQGKKTLEQMRALKRLGWDYILIKTGEGGGTLEDAMSFAPFAAHNIQMARRAGLDVGPYHFVHPRDGRRGRDEAKIAWECAINAGWDPRRDKHFAIDFEKTHLPSGRETRRYALSFIRRIKEYQGGKPWFYTFTSFWNEQGFWRPMGCMIWQADYTKDLKRPPGSMRGLLAFGRKHSPIKRWQWTSEGKVPGFHAGDLDLNTGSR